MLDEPAAGTATRALARCVLAFLAAAGGDPGGSAELIAAVVADTAAWRRETPAVQYALQMAEGTMVSVSMDLTAIDRILAAEFARLAQAGGFGFGSGWVSLLQARAALLRGRTDEALWATEQACAALAPARVYDGGAHFARANVAALLGQVTLAVDALAVAESAMPAAPSGSSTRGGSRPARGRWRAGASSPRPYRCCAAPRPGRGPTASTATSCSPSTTWSGSGARTWPRTGWPPWAGPSAGPPRRC
nr:hypothetical protein GCM10020092_095590 [Actinoplanes digitatis]